MASPNSGEEVHNVSAATATEYVQKLVKLEAVTSGTNERAFDTLSRRYDVTVSQLVHLYKGRAKTCDVSLFARVKLAYLDRCARMVAALQHDIAIEEASSGDALDRDLAAEAAALAEKIAAQAAAIRQGAAVK